MKKLGYFLGVVGLVGLIVLAYWFFNARDQGPAAMKQYYTLSDSLRIIDREIGRAVNDSAMIVNELGVLRSGKSSKKTAAEIARLGVKIDSLSNKLQKLYRNGENIESALEALKKTAAYRFSEQ